MKKLLIFIGVMVCFAGQAQNLATADSNNIVKAKSAIHNVTDSVIEALADGVMKVLGMVHMAFFLILIFCASMFNEAVEADNWASWLSFLKKIPRGMRTFIIGILFLIVSAWAYRIKDRVIIFETVLTIILAMATMSVGINKIVRFIAQRFGLTFGQK